MAFNRSTTGLAAPSAERLANQWLPLHTEWEDTGQWRQLLDWSQHLATPSPRWLAASARAAAFQGLDELYSAFDAQLTDLQHAPRASHEGLEDAQCQAVWLLARSARARRAADWASARATAESAREAAALAGSPALLADADFAIALCLDEEGRFYLALDTYQRLARDRGLSSYRRGLAALNEAWSLWDLGRPHALPRIRPLVPDAFRPRLDLMTALSSLDEHLILEQLGPLPPSICENEKPWLALVLLEWAFLTGGKARRRVRDSWLHDFIQSSASPELTRGLKACLDGRPLPKAAKTGVWRDDLDFAFLRALSWLDHDPGQALAIYRSAVEPILLERELETSLIPQLSTFASPPTAWTRRLGARLGIAAGAENALRVRVQRTEVAFTHGERTGSFAIARSPKTFQVLRALAGPAGRVITKQRLHEHLTGSRYVSHLHDDRLYKLLGRLAPRLESLTGTRVWAWSGQNDLVLLARIEVDND